ncbi:MAG: S41 family peptidase [Rubricoccaceae bacterium]
MFAALLALLLIGPTTDWHPLRTDGTIDARVHGIWQTRGYGMVMDVGAHEVRVYNVGRAGCLPDEETAYYVNNGLEVFSRAGDVLRVAYRPTNSTVYTTDRIDALPAACATPPSDSPTEVFDYLWHSMDEYYAFFELRGIDWDARRAAIAPRIRDGMSDEDLFDALSDLLDGFNDGHLTLNAEIDGAERSYSTRRSKVLADALKRGFKAQTEIETEGEFSGRWFFGNRRMIRETVLDSTTVGRASGGNIVWGRRGRIGYIVLGGMMGFAEDGDESLAGDIAGAHVGMNAALTDLADTDAIVFDLAFNQGGYDEISLAIASHFANEPTLGLTKYAFMNEADTRQAFTVEPTPGVRYLKPVTLLTSDLTVSAAETFTMEMRALPNVTHVGEPTNGALSDILFRPLPNGWTLELSHEVYLDAEGELWENRGIPPDVPITVFALDDLGSYVSTVTGVMDWLNATLDS